MPVVGRPWLLIANAPQKWRHCGTQQNRCWTLLHRPPGAASTRGGRARATVTTPHWVNGRRLASVRFLRRMRWQQFRPLVRRRLSGFLLCGRPGRKVVRGSFVGGHCDDVGGINVAPPRLPAIAGGARPPLTGRRSDWRDRRQGAARRVSRTARQCDDQFPRSGMIAMFAQPNTLPGAQREFALADGYR